MLQDNYIFLCPHTALLPYITSPIAPLFQLSNLLVLLLPHRHAHLFFSRFVVLVELTTLVFGVADIVPPFSIVGGAVNWAWSRRE
jgi:hypothetical protein